MANYRTNYFRVTDENKYNEFFERLYGWYGEETNNLSKEENGTILHAFGGYGNPEYWIGLPEEEECEDLLEDLYTTEPCCASLYQLGIIELIQKFIPENEVFILLEDAEGSENLKYFHGNVLIVTAYTSKVINLAENTITESKEILGKKFNTEFPEF